MSAVMVSIKKRETQFLVPPVPDITLTYFSVQRGPRCRGADSECSNKYFAKLVLV